MNGTTASASDDGAGVTEGGEGGPSFPQRPACAGATLSDVLNRLATNAFEVHGDLHRAGDVLKAAEERIASTSAGGVLDRLANAAPTARSALDRLARGETDQ